ncbi:MAG: 3-isopropylmalate dehydrogenase, partial [Cocleimonas sp.]|nr:3-isopropylmalate dehydrogenase [Cocleimonas sp.]
DNAALADKIDAAVEKVLEQGYRTADIFVDGMELVGTDAMGDAVIVALKD